MKRSKLTPKVKPHLQETASWQERLLATIAERDQALLEQLSRMNHSMERMLQKSQSQHQQTIATVLDVLGRLHPASLIHLPPGPPPVVSQEARVQPVREEDQHTYQNPSSKKIAKRVLARREPATQTTPLGCDVISPVNTLKAREYFGSEEKSNSSPYNYDSGDSLHTRSKPNREQYQASYTEFSDDGEWYGHEGHFIKLAETMKHEEPRTKTKRTISDSEFNRFRSIQPAQFTELYSADRLKLQSDGSPLNKLQSGSGEEVRRNRKDSHASRKGNQLQAAEQELSLRRARQTGEHSQNFSAKELPVNRSEMGEAEERSKLSQLPMKPSKDRDLLGVVAEQGSEPAWKEQRPVKLSNSMKRIQPFSKKGANLLLDIPAINGEDSNTSGLASQQSLKLHTDPQIQLTVPVETRPVERDFQSQPLIRFPEPMPQCKESTLEPDHPHIHVEQAATPHGQDAYIIVTKPASAEKQKHSPSLIHHGPSMVDQDSFRNGYLTPRVALGEATHRPSERDLLMKPRREEPQPYFHSKQSKQSREDLNKSTIKNENHPSMSFPTRLALVQFEQKQLIVEIQPIVNAVLKDSSMGMKHATLAISKWVAEVYDTLSKQTFSGYFSRHLSEPDAKVFFTHNLALNFEHMIEYFWANHKALWQNSKDTLIRHFETESSNTLEFMMVKYPQKRKTYISEQIRNAIPVKDESEDPEFDVIRNTSSYFEYDPSKRSYCRKIKMFLNRLMAESQKHLPEFRRLMKGIFTVQRNGFDYELKNLIGMKFKENSPQYTKKEIEEDGIQIKAPEILRIIIKWIAELERKVRNLGGGISIHNSFTAKKEGASHHLNKFMKEDLKNFMAQKMTMLDQAEDEMRLRIRSVLSLFPEYLDKYMNNFAYIKPTEVKSGLLSFVLSETASNLSINYLTFIIDLLEEGSLKTKRFEGKGQILVKDNEGDSFVENVEYKDFEFVTFTISDLLRCKCSGSLAEIKEVWKRLNSHSKLRVYRVKNRLDTSNRDFLVNARLNDTPILCEIQLSITDKSVDEKETYLNHFSHFIYELSRASYGPIAEAVIINSYLTEFVSFFRQSLSRIVQTRKPLENLNVLCSESGVMSIQGYVQRNNNFTFVCSNCLELRIANTRHLFNFDSSHSILAHDQQVERTDQIKHIICGDCAFSNLTPTQQSAYLLRTPLSFFFVSVSHELELTEPIVCAVQKSTSNKKIVVLQRCEQEKSVIFVPVFYECQTDKIRVPLSALREKYYLFKLKPGLKINSIDIKRFVGEVCKDRQTFEILDTMIELFLSPMLAPQEDEPENRFLTEYKDRQVVFSAQHMNVEELLKLNCEKIDVIQSPEFNYMLVLNAHRSQEELAKIIKKGRQLKEVDLNFMMKTSVWKLENSNLDNESFEIPLFNQDTNHIVEVRASENNFTKLHFISSQTLRRLDLSSNAIRKLQLEERDFPSLETLDLASNQIDMVSSVHHYSLRSLFLGGNRIAKLHEENWRLPSLEHLQVSGNSLKSLNISKMKCPKLRELDAGQNGMEVFELPTAVYFLERVSLSDNSLKQLNFSHVRFSSLKRLMLARNQLESVKLPDAMEGLEELSLMGNALRVVDLSRTRIPRIKAIDLSHNQLEFADLPEELDSLQVLNLSHNSIHHLCLSKMRLKSLRDLSTQDNPLEDIFLPPRLPRLECIVMAGCRLTSIDFSVCSTPRIKMICLQSNKLAAVRLPSDLATLEELCLKNNNLPRLELANIELSELRVLDISRNQIGQLTFPASINKAERIDISHNLLPALDVSAVKLSALKELDISHNLLEECSIGKEVSNLEHISVNHNRLVQLDLSQLSLGLLRHLDISTNMLQMLRLKEDFVFGQLRTIDSRYNLFVSPIPSNVPIASGLHFPLLQSISVGANDLSLTSLWLLWIKSKEERSELYSRIVRRSFRMLNAELIESILAGAWQEQELPKDLKAELARVTEYLSETQGVPEAYGSQLRNLLLQTQGS